MEDQSDGDDSEYIEALRDAVDTTNIGIVTLTISSDPHKVKYDMAGLYDALISPIYFSEAVEKFISGAYTGLLLSTLGRFTGDLGAKFTSEMIDFTDNAISSASGMPTNDQINTEEFVDPGTYNVYKFFSHDEVGGHMFTSQYTILLEQGTESTPHLFIYGYEDHSWVSSGEFALVWYENTPYIHEFNPWQ